MPRTGSSANPRDQYSKRSSEQAIPRSRKRFDRSGSPAANPQHSRRLHRPRRDPDSTMTSPQRKTRPLTHDRLLDITARAGTRDRLIAGLVDAHRVLTTRQITQLCFGSEATARTRLHTLTSLRVLARFRPRRDTGSHPGHYVLDTGGAFLLEHDIPDRDHRRHRVDKRLAWATSQRLPHLTGTNSFFTTLAATARHHPDTFLPTWAPGHWCEKWLSLINLAPDGFGTWVKDQQLVDFFLEYDTGTEHLAQLTKKLTQYQRLANGATGAPGPPTPCALFVFASSGRETHARHALTHAAHGKNLPLIATAAYPAEAHPAGCCWLPLPTNPDNQPRRHTLADLGRLAGHPRQPADYIPTAPNDLRLAPAWPPLPTAPISLTADPRPTGRWAPRPDNHNHNSGNDWGGR
ncbi:hypothetical protein Asera_35550 [Actinocatenispora sera]|uniref:Protein involved in plasmid replication-relaxation n=2 Tax=Actinocatenispora sera TaxID=390989 RepID=A0A810L2K8_9ACTN|nr:hypothetical protein Asera_35550 [Actinocatenispora sera]